MTLDNQPLEKNYYSVNSSLCEDDDSRSVIETPIIDVIEDTSFDTLGEKDDFMKTDSLMETFPDGAKCTVCGKEIKGKFARQNMKQHIYSHVEGVTYPCNQCGKLIRSSTALKRHISIEHKKQPNQSVTSIPHTNKLNYQLQLNDSKQWNNDPVYSRRQIKKIYKASDANHENSSDKIDSMMETFHDDDIAVKCSVCGKESQGKSARKNMRQHLYSHLVV